MPGGASAVQTRSLRAYSSIPQNYTGPTFFKTVILTFSWIFLARLVDNGQNSLYLKLLRKNRIVDEGNDATMETMRNEVTRVHGGLAVTR